MPPGPLRQASRRRLRIESVNTVRQMTPSTQQHKKNLKTLVTTLLVPLLSRRETRLQQQHQQRQGKHPGNKLQHLQNSPPSPQNPKHQKLTMANDSLRPEAVTASPQQRTSIRPRKPLVKWPAAGTVTLQRIANANPVWGDLGPYASKMAWLIDVEPGLRWKRFQQEVASRQLAPSTALTYWNMFLKLMKVLQERIPSADIQAQKNLKKSAKAYVPDRSAPFTEEMALQMSQDTPLDVALLIAYAGGQRISDMVQLHADDVTWEDTHVTIMVRRGKMIGRIPPYAFFLPRADFPGLLRLVALRKGKFLFSEQNSKAERDSLTRRVRARIKPFDSEMTAVGLRMGGLQRMAKAGTRETIIKAFSQHRDDEVLMGYLDHGTSLTSRREAMLTASARPAMKTKK